MRKSHTKKPALIQMLDLEGHSIKSIYPRYATQRVLNGQAKWILNKTAIQVIDFVPILLVFPTVGTRKEITSAMRELEFLYNDELFPKHKAAGSLGGASRAKLISLTADGRTWVRIR